MRRRLRNQLVLDLDRGGRRLLGAGAPDGLLQALAVVDEPTDDGQPVRRGVAQNPLGLGFGRGLRPGGVARCALRRRGDHVA